MKIVSASVERISRIPVMLCNRCTVLSPSYESTGVSSMESQRFRRTSLYDITICGSLVRANARKMPYRERKKVSVKEEEREKRIIFQTSLRNRDYRFPMTLA